MCLRCTEHASGNLRFAIWCKNNTLRGFNSYFFAISFFKFFSSYFLLPLLAWFEKVWRGMQNNFIVRPTRFGCGLYHGTVGLTIKYHLLEFRPLQTFSLLHAPWKYVKLCQKSLLCFYGLRKSQKTMGWSKGRQLEVKMGVEGWSRCFCCCTVKTLGH